MPDLTQMAQQTNDGLAALQTVVTVLGSMGLFKAGERAVRWWQKRRNALAESKRRDARVEQDAQEQDYEQARQIKKDWIVEHEGIIAQKDAIIAQKDQDIQGRDAAYKAYQKFAHDRLDLASAKILELHADKVITAGQIARFEERLKLNEERLKECEDDRTEMRHRIEKLEAAR